MDYCSLEDAWGVKSFVTGDMPTTKQRCPDPVSRGAWPVSGPFGYRPPRQDLPQQIQNMHPVSECYLHNGVDGVLQALPQQAIDDLRSRLAVSNLNTVAGLLLFGFVLLIVYDVLFKRR